MMTRLRHWFLRTVVFPRSAQLRILSALQVQLKAGVGVADAMSYQREITRDHQVRRVTDLALSSLSAGQPFPSLFAAQGYYTAADVRLLDVADRHGALIPAIDLIMAEADPEESFGGVVLFANAQWIAGLVAMVLIAMLGTEYESVMTFGDAPPQSFFQVGHWLNSHLWWVLILAVVAIIAYRRARVLVRGPLRLQLRAAGIFGVYDRQVLIRLLVLMSLLLRHGVAPRHAVEEVAIIASTNKRGHLTRSIQATLNSLRAGDSLADGLGNLLHADHITLIKLQSGRETPAELAQALATLSEVIRHELKQQLRLSALLVAVTSALGAFALLIPLINTLMGTGFITEY